MNDPQSSPRPPSSRAPGVTAAATVAVLFGILTLKSGGSVLFVDGAARTAAGNYVPFVLWFNFLAGFAYILAGTGLFLWREWAVNLSLLIAVSTLIMFAAFSLTILFGGDFEPRTIAAMALRSSVWLAIAWLSRKAWNSRQVSL